MNNLSQIAMELKQAQSISIMGHMNPDGDSIGSTLAVGLALKKLSKNVKMYCVDGIPQVFDFLPGFSELEVIDELTECDVLLMVDCTDIQRVGEKLDLKGKTIINVDHHISNQHFGSYNYVRPEAAATGEIIYDLIKALGVELDKEIAQAIYVAIVMDTGSFRYSNTSAHTHGLISELIDLGIEVGPISTQLFETRELTAIKVLSAALSSLSFSDDQKVAWMVLDYHTLQQLQAKDEHIDDVINYSRMINGVEIGLLFRELEPDKLKVSLRSKHYADVNKLAALFGGGGHERASGCRLTGNIKEKVEEVVTAAVQAVQQEQQ
jgi:bifunctional oligoribonuclease and PAP phosphatase NrnA